VSGFLPFTAEQFFATFAAYNEAIWPAQPVAYALGIGAMALAFARSTLAAGAVLAVLTAMWVWTGVAYHMIFFAAINPAAFVFGLLFVIEAAALLLAGGARRDVFATAPLTDVALGLALCAYALVVYPLIGWWMGHVYPAAPAFGVTPCPVTIFTFGVLFLYGRRAPWAVVAVPLLWCVIGGSAAILLGVVQDWALPVSGALYLARRWPRSLA
jgi:hypothetical protein